ncbi:sigma-54 interaction domain-containing protein [Oceanobacillus jeddahense]|uniref:Sigma 54-interacting transcriptional regulator n=1 Tax=Oceanobacillus jeddahense TaxID=1462527 RepID=A0ABY5JW78_9BACI|nr:sigma 54-interacting transcriptional regulator [Oceanobacillus jeddahense]UUI03311.1 sigma 54-interacting transcriptional regulator [Oceanobacillus jeddahense]
MDILKDIAEHVQHMAEIISETFSMDVEIVDSNFVRIGAAGVVGKKINQAVSFGTTTREVLDDPKIIVVESKSNHFCSICPGRKKCPYYGGIVAPVLYNNEAIGVINILGYYKEDMEKLINNQHRLFNFIEKITNMISLKIKEIETKLICQKVQDDLPYGLIMINHNGIVQSTNNEANYLLAREKNLLGKHINEVLGRDINLFENMEQSIEIKITNSKDRWNKNDNVDIHVEAVNQKNNLLGFLITINKKKNNKEEKIEVGNETRFLERIIGESSAIKEMKQKTARFAKSSSTIILEGESGTGKELFAEAIHYNSNRSTKPFIPINASAIPESLVESELFGYEKNTFTGADRDGKIGIFEAANGGTIFIDEIATIPFYLQRKLLRFLENKEVFRIGSTKPRKLDVRIVTATNEDLKELVKEGKFRKDLYYRLNVLSLRIPPLRERGHDILILADYFLHKFCLELKKENVFISKHTKNLLLNHVWEGNIRELKNVMEFAVHDLKDNRKEIKTENLPSYLMEDLVTNQSFINNEDEKNVASIEQYEKNILNNLINEVRAGKETMSNVAKTLGISRSTLYRKIKSYNLKA